MFKLTIATVLAFISFVSCYPQHQQQIDPAYLQQYYAQIAQAAGARSGAIATPIYEQDNSANQQPQYVAQGQQIRVKDTAQEQARAQQQQRYVAPSVRQYLHHPQQVKYAPPPQQQIQYNAPQPAKQTIAVPRRLPIQQSKYQDEQLSKEEEEAYDQNPSYQFGFDVKDDEFTNYQNRKEVRDGNVIKGSYSVVDSDGFIRTVTYTADPKEGFKAEVVREPTDIVVKIPTPPPQTLSAVRSHPQTQQQQQPQYAPQPNQYRAQYKPQPQQYQYEQ